jgi:hypothetical protein
LDREHAVAHRLEWESGKTKPRPQSLAAIAALRGIGKREVAARLEALKQVA